MARKKKLTDKEKEIAQIIYNELDHMYCDNCRSNNEISRSNENNGCEDCHRKYNGWAISMATAENIAIQICKGEKQ